LALIGCKKDSEPGYYGTVARHGHAPRTLYINNGDEPEFLDPGLVSEQSGSCLVLDLFEGLVDQHPRDLHIIQGVAERYDQSADNRVWRFHLRENARWSDGQPVTAADFAYAWQRVLRPETGSRQVAHLQLLKNGEAFSKSQIMVVAAAADGWTAGTVLRVLSKKDGVAEVETFDDLPTFRADKRAPSGTPKRGRIAVSHLRLDPSVLGVRAVSERVLEVELERATPYFLELVAYHTYYPVRRDVIEAAAKAGDVDRWTRPEHIVSNGSFVLKKHSFRYEIVFEKNPHYWGAADIKTDRIVWLEVASYDAALALYKGGEIDYIGSVTSLPEKYVPMLRNFRDFSEAPWQSSYWYEFNVSKAPLDDVRVRKALNLAVDKRQIIDKVTRMQQIPATHFVPDYTGSGYSAAAEAARAAGDDPFSSADWRFDPERARALLREAGYTLEQRDGRWYAKGFPGLELLYNGAVGATSGHPAIAVAVQSMWRDNLGVSATLRNEEWKIMLKNMRDGNYQVARLGWSADYNHPHTYLETFLSTSPNNWTRWKDAEYDALVEKAAATADPAASMKLYRQAELRAVEGMPRLPIYFYTKASMAKPYLRGFYPNALNRHAAHFMWIDPDWRSGPGAEPVVHELPPPGRIE
jgi:oligopeptide transport system substrate-binding protein